MSDVQVVYIGPHASGTLEVDGEVYPFTRDEPVKLPVALAKTLGDDWATARSKNTPTTKDDDQ